MDIWALAEYLRAGFKLEDLTPASLPLEAANKSATNIVGAFFTTIPGIISTASPISHKSMMYVSMDVLGFYLSKASMFELAIIARDSPTPRCALTNK